MRPTVLVPALALDTTLQMAPPIAINVQTPNQITQAILVLVAVKTTAHGNVMQIIS